MSKTVLVNGYKIQKEVYDTIENIIVKYAIQNNNTPNMYRVETITPSTENVSKIVLKTIRDEIKGKPINDLPEFKKLYPNVSYFDLFTVWFLENESVNISDLEITSKYSSDLQNKIRKHEKTLKQISRKVFANFRDLTQNVINFESKIQTKVEEITNNLEKITSRLENFSETTPIPRKDFIPKSIDYTYEIATNSTLEEIFFENHCDTKTTLMVLNSFPQGLQFKTFRNFSDKFRNVFPYLSKEVSYSDAPKAPTGLYFVFCGIEGYWSPSTKINLRISNPKCIEYLNEFETIFLGKHKIISRDSSENTGDMEFEFPRVVNRLFMADLIGTNPIVSTFCFLNENSEYENPKSILEKERFQVYFAIFSNYQITESLSFRMNLCEPVIKGSQTIRISMRNILSPEIITIFGNVFSRILTIYLESISEYEEIYKSYSWKQFQKDTPKQKVNRKTQKKLSKLEDFFRTSRPVMLDMYIDNSKYSRQCQQKFQPSLIEDPEEIADLWENAPNKIMAFEYVNDNPKVYRYLPREVAKGRKVSDFGNPIDYYTCEEGYPYAKIPSKKWDKITFKNMDAEFGGIPCCSKSSLVLRDDQFPEGIKGANKFYYDNFGKTVKTQTYEISKKISDAYVQIDTQKFVGISKIGSLPKYIEFYVSREFNTVNIGSSKKVYPILRYGVTNSVNPYSFLICCMKSVNDKSEITKVLQNLQEFPKFCMSQELAENQLNFSDTDKILGSEKFLDPKIFIRLFEEYFSLNIILFEISKKFPHGNFCLPSNVYLYPTVNPLKPVCCVLYRKDENVCELIVKYNKPKNFDLNFKTSDPLIQTFFECRKRSFREFSFDVTSFSERTFC